MSWVRRNNFVVVLSIVLVAIVVGVMVAPSNKTHKHRRYGIGTGVHLTVAPKLTLLGGNVCHEGAKTSFKYRISGFPPRHRVWLLVFYGGGSPYTDVAGSKGQPAGVIKLKPDGTYTSHNEWQCWSFSAGASPDPLTAYVAWVYDPKTQVVSPPVNFTVVS